MGHIKTTWTQALDQTKKRTASASFTRGQKQVHIKMTRKLTDEGAFLDNTQDLRSLDVLADTGDMINAFISDETTIFSRKFLQTTVSGRSLKTRSFWCYQKI